MAEAGRGAESFPGAWRGALPRGFNPPKVKFYQFILPLKGILPTPPQGKDAETVGQKPSGSCDSHSLGSNQH